MYIDGFPYLYTRPVADLGPGAGFGNPDCFVRCDRESNLAGLWCTDGQWYCGRLEVTVAMNGKAAMPTTTTFAPAWQSTRYELDSLRLDKTAFLPYGAGYSRGAYILLRLKRAGVADVPFPSEVEITVRARFPAVAAAGYPLRPPLHQEEKPVEAGLRGEVLVARTAARRYGAGFRGNALETRVLGIPGLTPAEHHSHRGGLSILRYRVSLEHHEDITLPVILAVSPDGEEAALAGYRTARDWRPILAATRENINRATASSDIFTPDPVINRGIAWSKVNSLRVQHRFPAGWGFTNDPPQDIVVVRDVAWYVFGSDYLTPAFSRGMLETVARHGQYENGKAAEFIEAAARPPRCEDDGLNINDGTPLFVLAVRHHYAVTGDEGFLEDMFPRIRNAIAWILSQRRDNLIWTEPAGTNVWGISGWRNIVAAYTLSGHVTEVNAACYGALRAAATLARARGEEGLAREWEGAAAELREAINSRLLSPRTGLYGLCAGPDGNLDEDLTGDLAFPLLFGLADGEVAKRAAEVLFSPAFWTPFGCRTVGADDPFFDPEHAYQLMGGIWPNLTAWVAHACRRLRPGVVAEALRNTFRLSEAEVPAAWGNVCPGQFPERLHGENFTSRGMPLSPWMPPTYLWLAVEGLAGVVPRPDGVPAIEPSPPPGWNWLGARRIPLGEEEFSFFLLDGTIHASRPVTSSLPVVIYDADVTDRLEIEVTGTSRGTRAFALALAKGDETALFLATEAACRVRIGGPGPDLKLELFPGRSRLLRLRREAPTGWNLEAPGA